MNNLNVVKGTFNQGICDGVVPFCRFLGITMDDFPETDGGIQAPIDTDLFKKLVLLDNNLAEKHISLYEKYLKESFEWMSGNVLEFYIVYITECRKLLTTV